MSKSKNRFRQSVERLLFVLAFLGGGGYLLYWLSPVNLVTLDTSVTGATWLHDQEEGYDVAFTAESIVCGFRYDSLWPSRRKAEIPLSKGDKVSLVVAASEFDKAARSLGRDCRTGERIPGTMALMVPSPALAPRLIEPLDVWRDGWVVLHWLPYRWVLSLVGALFVLTGLMILFGPLIDRYTNPYHKPRLGMKALSAFDEEAKRRRERNR